jgi:hypothetical protein
MSEAGVERRRQAELAQPKFDGNLDGADLAHPSRLIEQRSHPIRSNAIRPGNDEQERVRIEEKAVQTVPSP